MYPNHVLKGCWVDLLSSTHFNSNEFKDIRKKFIDTYPQFGMDILYQKIYQAFRDAQAEGLMVVNTSVYPYQYTSNCKNSLFISKLDDFKKIDLTRKQLRHEHERLKGEAIQITLEIEVLSKYMKLYPAINKNIASFISENTVRLKDVQAEISILDKIISKVSNANL